MSFAAPIEFYERQEKIKASPLYPQIQYMNSQLNQMQEGTPQYEMLKAKLFAMQDQAAGGVAPQQQQMPQIPGRSGGIEGLAEMLQKLGMGKGQRSPGQYPDTVPVPSRNDDLIVDFPILERAPKPQRGDVPDYIKTAPPKPPRPPIFENPFGSEGRRPPRPPILDDIFGDEGQLPPMMRTNDFQDRNGNRIDDRDEKAGVKRRRIPSRRIKDSYRQRGGLAGRIAQLTEQMRGREDRPMPRGGMFRDLMRRVQSERDEPRMQAPLQNMLAPPPEQYFAERNRREMDAPDMEAIRRQIMQNMRIRGIGI